MSRMGEDRLEVEAPLQRGGHVIDATVAGVRGRDDVEAFASEHHAVGVLKFGHGHHTVRENRQKAVLEHRALILQRILLP